MDFDVLIFNKDEELIFVFEKVNFTQLNDVAFIYVPIGGYMQAFALD